MKNLYIVAHLNMFKIKKKKQSKQNLLKSQWAIFIFLNYDTGSLLAAEINTFLGLRTQLKYMIVAVLSNSADKMMQIEHTNYLYERLWMLLTEYSDCMMSRK